jgi:hypothetical protein
VCGACGPLSRCAAYDRSCNPGCLFSGRCLAGATEFAVAFADLLSVLCVALAAELSVVAVDLLRDEAFACPVFFEPAGAALLAAELLVDVFAVLLFFSFVRIETGLRAFVIAFDRSRRCATAARV